MKTQIENPNGLHQKYYLRKLEMIKNPDFGKPDSDKATFNNKDEYIPGYFDVDPNSEYFVLRLDKGGKDAAHINACRIGVNAYADAIESHIPQLAKDIRERWPVVFTDNGQEGRQQ